MNRQTAAAYAPLFAAYGAGATIQANRKTEDGADNWVSLGDDVQFTCAPELYRVAPAAEGTSNG